MGGAQGSLFPEGPGIEKIRSPPSELKISSAQSWIEIFDRDLLCNTRRAPYIETPRDWTFRSRLKFSVETENFKPGLTFSIGIKVFRSQGPLGSYRNECVWVSHSWTIVCGRSLPRVKRCVKIEDGRRLIGLARDNMEQPNRRDFRLEDVVGEVCVRARLEKSCIVPSKGEFEKFFAHKCRVKDPSLPTCLMTNERSVLARAPCIQRPRQTLEENGAGNLM